MAFDDLTRLIGEARHLVEIRLAAGLHQALKEQVVIDHLAGEFCVEFLGGFLCMSELLGCPLLPERQFFAGELARRRGRQSPLSDNYWQPCRAKLDPSADHVDSLLSGALRFVALEDLPRVSVAGPIAHSFQEPAPVAEIIRDRMR